MSIERDRVSELLFPFDTFTTSASKEAVQYLELSADYNLRVTNPTFNAIDANSSTGGIWYMITNPSTGWCYSKISGWTANNFTTGSFVIDFSSVVPTGTKRVKIVLYIGVTSSDVWARAYEDSNFSNTPGTAPYEFTCLIGSTIGIPFQTELPVDPTTGKTQITVANTGTHVYFSDVIGYLL